MAAWVEDVLQALKNLGGQATLSQIYEEVKRIRQVPLTQTWQASIRERLEAHSSDSENFRGTDYFRKVGKGTWALRNPVTNTPQPSTQTTINHALPGFMIPESFETIINALQTVKQYRDYADPAASTWVAYIQELFQVMGFGTENCDSRLFFLKDMAGNSEPKAIVGYSLPGENIEEIIPGLKWETYILFASNYYHLDWGIVTNGLQLKVINYTNGNQHKISSWPDLDGIIKNQKSDSFFPIYKLFAHIKQGSTEKVTAIKPADKTLIPQLKNSSDKYAPIQAWLEKQKANGEEHIEISFHNLETILGEPLPNSAYTQRAWWANGGHMQAFAWINAGWLIKSVDLTAKNVSFYRSIEQHTSDNAYQSFFGDLLQSLKEKRPNVTQASKTLPQNWFSFSSGRSGFPLGWVLPKEKVLRVELYIDTGNWEKNKGYFDALLMDKSSIEREIGNPLQWERLDHRRASRISISTPFNLAGSADQHDMAKQWGVAMMLKFIDTFKPRIKNL